MATSDALEVLERGLGVVDEVRIGLDDPHRLSVLHPVEGVDAAAFPTDARRRVLGRLDLGDQPAGRWIPAGKVDASTFPDHAATSVATDQVARTERLAVG